MKKIFVVMVCAFCALTMQAETFVQVTDASSLADGDQVLMGYAVGNKVSAGFSDTKKFLAAVDATIVDGSATVSNPTVLTLKRNGNYWNLYIGSKPVGHASGTNDLDAKMRYTTNYAITIEANGTAKIVSQTPGKNNAEVYFRYNAGSPRFNVYAANSTAIDIQLYKLDAATVEVNSVTLDTHSAELRVGNTLNLQATVAPDNAVDKTIAWGSTDEAVATVADGVISAVGVGTAKIWVKATAVENVSDTCVLTVLPAPAVGDATYNAIRSADDLPEGAKVFVGTIRDGENYVMGQYVSGNNIHGETATYGPGRHSVTAPLQVAYTVERDGDKYLFVDHDGKYLRTISSSKLGSGANDQYAKWTLGAIDATDATVTLTASNGNNIYNNFNNDMFNIYSSIGDGSNLAKIILYSDQAAAWPTTGIDEAAAAQKAQKIIRNGRVLIRRNGETYFITGERVND